MILPFCLLVATAPPAQGPVLIPPQARHAAETITADRMRAHIRFLSSDLLEGRGPATRGDALAESYIASEMEGLGLQGGAPDGTFYQPFDVVGILSHAPASITFQGPQGSVELRHKDDVIMISGVPDPEARLSSAELVFVGYGIKASEYNWDDYKGADLRGKVLVMMNDNPEDFPKTGGKKTRYYYGRWDYKYETAAKHGAVGAIIIHTTPSAGYPWHVVQNSWGGEKFTLPSSGEAQLRVLSWATEEASRKIVRLAGKDLDSLRAAAEKRDFEPVPLGVTLSVELRNDVQTKRTANIIGRLPGADPLLAKEAVFYTAHHDHLGIRPVTKPGEDTIYNGAMDNASGVASMLTIARAFVRLKIAPKRTTYFAAVAGEEQGLLGSEWLARHLPCPRGRVAADINIDGINIWGRTRDVAMIGFGKSTLDDYIRAIAQTQGRVLTADAEPDKGYFYRSDQFNFARIGVPSAFFSAGVDVIGKPPGFGKAAHDEFEEKDYHQPSDELRSNWDFSGAIEDAQLLFYLGFKVGNTQKMPVWKPGDEFEQARKSALAEIP